jgi:hypothetical protein
MSAADAADAVITRPIPTAIIILAAAFMLSLLDVLFYQRENKLCKEIMYRS